MDDFADPVDDFADQALDYEARRLRSDRTLIKAGHINAQAIAIERVTRALEEMIDARNRHTAALEREAKALRELEDAKQFADVDARTKRKPAARAFLKVEGLKRKRG
jgi:hypothetical protein